MEKASYSHQKVTRQQNTSLLLRDLWQNAPLSRSMLAQRNGLTKGTVTAICNELAALGLIREAGQDRTGLGRPGELIQLNPAARCAIGVEVSTNYVATVLKDLCGEPLAKSSSLIDVGDDPDSVLTQAETLISETVDRARERAIPILGIGVAVPGLVDPGPESLVSAPALGWKGLPLKQSWEERFALPVIVENKARAAAAAEALNGCAQGVKSFVYVSLGTDVGATVQAAVVNDGLSYRGAHGMGVDAGHMILDPNGPQCVCGQRGCWQVMTDVAREVELAHTRLAAGKASVLHRHTGGQNSLDHRTIHQAAVDGDALALDVVRTVQEFHALGITNLVRLFDPELVIIGWASLALSEAYHTRMNSLSTLLDTPAAVAQMLALRGVALPSIVRAAHGPEACLAGAAALVVDEFLRMPPVVGT